MSYTVTVHADFDDENMLDRLEAVLNVGIGLWNQENPKYPVTMIGYAKQEDDNEDQTD